MSGGSNLRRNAHIPRDRRHGARTKVDASGPLSPERQLADKGHQHALAAPNSPALRYTTRGTKTFVPATCIDIGACASSGRTPIEQEPLHPPRRTSHSPLPPCRSQVSSKRRSPSSMVTMLTPVSSAAFSAFSTDHLSYAVVTTTHQWKEREFAMDYAPFPSEDDLNGFQPYLSLSGHVPSRPMSIWRHRRFAAI